MAEDPRLYVRRDGRTYRITIQRDTVWIEQQNPRPFAGNRPMSTRPEDLYDGNSWDLDVLDTALKEYDKVADNA